MSLRGRSCILSARPEPVEGKQSHYRIGDCFAAQTTLHRDAKQRNENAARNDVN